MTCNPSFTDKSALPASAASSLGETSPADTASPVRSSASSRTVVHSCEQASQSGSTTSKTRHERQAGPVSCERKATKHNVPAVEEVHLKDDDIYSVQCVLAKRRIITGLITVNTWCDGKVTVTSSIHGSL